MTIITKAALAAELKVSKARVSQYLRAGLPERSDGKLDRGSALNWIALNLRSSPDRRKGLARARELRPEVRPPARSLGDGEAARRAAVAVAGQVAFYVASVASDLDLPMRLVNALARNVEDGMHDVVAEVLFRYRLGDLGFERADLPPGVDWFSVAEGQGEQFDVEAWEAFRVEMDAKAGNR